jgi:hypothetical protein
MILPIKRPLAILVICLAASTLPPHQAESRVLQKPALTTAYSTLVSTPFPTVPVGPNIDIAGEVPPDRQQVETTVAIDPLNTSIIVAGAQDLRMKPLEHRWHGYYRSTDGGQTWITSLLPGFPGDSSPAGLSSPLRASNTTSDPVLAFDRQGNLYYAGLVFNVSANGPLGNGPIGNTVAFVAKYTNDGATYSGATLIKGPLFADKEWIAIDNTGGPYDGTVYLAFDANLTATSYFGTIFTRSTDGGRTFSSPFYAPADMTGELPGMTVDPSGNIYVSSLAYNPFTGSALNYTQVTKSAPGGAGIIQNVRAVNPAQWMPSFLPGGQFRTFTIPQIASDSKGVYLVFDDIRQGNASVFLTRSTDGGSTWTSPLRINDTPNCQHFFPTIASSGGIISVAWYDSRQNLGTTMNSLDVYFSESLDGGVNFLPNIRLTTNSFNPNTVYRTDSPNPAQRFMGDYTGIAATPTTAHPVWADNLNACDTIDPTWGCIDQDAFTSTISLADFTIAASPPTQTIQQGTTGTASVRVTSLNSYQGSVTVSSTSNPNWLPITPATTTLTLGTGGTSSFNLTFSPTTTTATQTYTVNVTGTTGPRAHYALVTVTVTSPSVGGTILPLQSARLLLYLLEITSSVAAIVLAGLILPLALYTNRKRHRQPAASSSES